MLILNVAVWGAILYLVFHIDDSKSHPVHYKLTAWLAVFLLVALLMLLLLWFVPWSHLTKSVGETLEGSRFSFFAAIPRFGTTVAANYGALVNLVNALACLGLVVAYFYANALDKYNTPKWQTNVTYFPGIAPPAFAFIGGYTDARMATLVTGPTNCSFPQWVEDMSNNCEEEAFPNQTKTLRTTSGVYGDLQAYIFQPSKLKPGKNLSTTLSDRVALQIPVSCKHESSSDTTLH